MLLTNTYVSWTASAKTHIQLAIPGDRNNPRIENVNPPKMGFVTDDDPRQD